LSDLQYVNIGAVVAVVVW